MSKDGIQQLIMERDVRKSSQTDAFTLDRRMSASSNHSISDVTVENMLEDERKRGFDKGYSEGVVKAQHDWEKKTSLVDNMIKSSQQLFNDVDDEIQKKLVEISVSIAKQIIQRELSIDSTQVTSAVKKALELIPNSEHEITVYINPDDEACVNDVFAEYLQSNRFKIFKDPSITIGGCKVSTDYSLIDLTIDSQIASIAADLLGDQYTEVKS